jgi:hypothetical protein
MHGSQTSLQDTKKAAQRGRIGVHVAMNNEAPFVNAGEPAVS